MEESLFLPWSLYYEYNRRAVAVFFTWFF